MNKIEMIATKAQTYAGRSVVKGDRLLATPSERKVLKAFQRAVDAPPKTAALLKPKEAEESQDPEVEKDVGRYETRVLEADAPRAKRPYNRRNVATA